MFNKRYSTPEQITFIQPNMYKKSTMPCLPRCIQMTDFHSMYRGSCQLLSTFPTSAMSTIHYNMEKKHIKNVITIADLRKITE